MNCVVSGAFSEPNGLVNIGTFTVQDGDLDAKNQYVDTAAVAQRNGMFTMCDSYAMLMRGDAVMNATNGAGHIVMIDEVNVVYGSDGKTDGTVQALQAGQAEITVTVTTKSGVFTDTYTLTVIEPVTE